MRFPEVERALDSARTRLAGPLEAAVKSDVYALVQVLEKLLVVLGRELVTKAEVEQLARDILDGQDPRTSAESRDEA